METKSQFSFSTAKLSFKKISTIHGKSVYFDYFALKILIINYQRHPTRSGNGGGGGQYPLTQNDNKKRIGDPLGLGMEVQIPPLLSLWIKRRDVRGTIPLGVVNRDRGHLKSPLSKWQRDGWDWFHWEWEWRGQGVPSLLSRNDNNRWLGQISLG